MKNIRSNECIRQGDVGLFPVKRIPKTAQRQDGPCVLAYGETTGHSHQVKTGGEIWVDVNDFGQRYLNILKDTSLDHEEHGWATLTKNDVYDIEIQREYFPGEIRTVVD